MMDHIYKGILDSLDSYIVVIEEDGIISFTNKKWGDLTEAMGAAINADCIGKSYFDCCSMILVNPDNFITQCKLQIAELLQGNNTEFVLEFSNYTINHEIWLEVTGNLVVFDQKCYVILNHSNIINRKRDRAEIEKLTLIDSVTGIANQKSFNNFYFNEWQRSMRNRIEMALLLGELEGDEIDDSQLKRIAKIFEKHARRACDLVAVLRNNQFALILGQTNSQSCEFVASEIHQEILQLNLLSIDGNQISINIGISSATPTLIDTSDMLFNSVDLALRKAKSSQQQNIYSHCPTISFKANTLLKI